MAPGGRRDPGDLLDLILRGTGGEVHGSLLIGCLSEELEWPAPSFIPWPGSAPSHPASSADSRRVRSTP
jgi:hypothetical protein